MWLDSIKGRFLMKIKGLPGEFAFKALTSLPKHNPTEWRLSLDYFFSLEDAIVAADGAEVKWPVEVYENGSIYIPSQEELED